MPVGFPSLSTSASVTSPIVQLMVLPSSETSAVPLAVDTSPTTTNPSPITSVTEASLQLVVMLPAIVSGFAVTFSSTSHALTMPSTAVAVLLTVTLGSAVAANTAVGTSASSITSAKTADKIFFLISSLPFFAFTSHNKGSMFLYIYLVHL